MKKLFVLPLFLCTFAFSQGAFAHEENDWMKLRTCIHHAIDKLNLTSDQRAKSKALEMDEKMKLHSIRKELHAIRIKIRLLVDNDNLNESELDQLIQQKKELIGQFIKGRVMFKHQLYMLLDTKQKAMFHEMAAKCDKID